jgi:hypothetical protein
MCIYIYIIYTPILASSAFVLGCEREQDRFKQAREKAARESKESSKKARKNRKKSKREQRESKREQ